jgi:hypothetical protein
MPSSSKSCSPPTVCTVAGSPGPCANLLLARTQVLTPEAQRFAPGSLQRRGAASITRSLRLVAGLPEDEALALIPRRALRNSCSFPDGDGYRLRHALLREALHADLLPGERVAVHASYARALEAAPDLGAQGIAASAAELADHWQEAGDAQRALTAWVEAGRAAEALVAFAEARQHFEHALAVWDRVPERGGTGRLVQARDRAASGRGCVPRWGPRRARPRSAAARSHSSTTVPNRCSRACCMIVWARYVWDTKDQPDALAIQRRAVNPRPGRSPVDGAGAGARGARRPAHGARPA